VHGRSKAKVDEALAGLRDELPGAELDGVSFDLGSLAGVRRGAEAIARLAPQLHVLVNNAGIFANERVVNDDGVEMTFAVNYLGPFLLTELLAPRMIESAAGGAPSRVIDVSSVAHTRGRIHLDDLQLERSWTGYAAYAQSKLANVMHAISLAERNDPKQLVAYSLHPGVVGTKLLRQGFGPVQGLTVETGARTSIRLAGGPRGHRARRAVGRVGQAREALTWPLAATTTATPSRRCARGSVGRAGAACRRRSCRSASRRSPISPRSAAPTRSRSSPRPRATIRTAPIGSTISVTR
jgi:NAD(P)-dependent dehydrogenase (short-subunit alcohol dehydrogenase family)